MSEHNFNSLKNFEVPETWVKGALDVPPQEKEKNTIYLSRILCIAACFTVIVVLSICVFAFYSSEKSVNIPDTNETSQTQKNSANVPNLSPAKSSLFEIPQNITPSFNSDTNSPTTANNICVGEFSDDLVVGEGYIYCVLYDYKTGELMGDENLLAPEHRAKFEDLGNGMVKATYNPVEKGVVKKSGEYWYVFYNELIMSPVQNYIYIYN